LQEGKQIDPGAAPAQFFEHPARFIEKLKRVGLKAGYPQ
jgi:hypothetical protein